VLRRVREGEDVTIITVNGRPVAVLTEPITDVGARLGWTVVSMARDWDVVFPPVS
jgi:antitoxin (DNA-binding transcriptional repressor) of toxin-antitoxin stability system